MFDGIAAELAPSPGREQRHGWVTSVFGDPGAQYGNSGHGERGDPIFAPLAVTTDIRAGAEMYVAASQPDQFRDPKSSLDREQQQGTITTPGPGVVVGAASSASISLSVRYVISARSKRFLWVLQRGVNEIGSEWLPGGRCAFARCYGVRVRHSPEN